MIKAAFFDVDGTLVPFGQKEISDSNIAALDSLRSAGVKVFVCSGRPRFLIRNLRDYPFDGYICCNGGVAYIGDEVIHSAPLDPEDIREAVRISDKLDFCCVAFTADYPALNLRTPIAERMMADINIHVDDSHSIEEAMKLPIYELTIFCSPEDERKYFAPAMKHSAYPRWNPCSMDVTPIGISKSEGIKKIAAHFGWDLSSLMCFGDGGTDIPMIEAVGYGVAMGNAAPDVKAAADYVTLSDTEDGIAHALRHYGLIR